MRVIDKYDYRHAYSILKSEKENILNEILSVLNDEDNSLTLGTRGRHQQDLSRQIKEFFIRAGWQDEAPHFSVPDLRYDLVKENVPIEIEIGHKRLVYADFFKFLIDYSNEHIPAGVMIVTETPESFGHTWHNSRENTSRKIETMKNSLLVPILVIGIEP